MSRKFILAMLGLSIGVALIGDSSFREILVGSAHGQATKEFCDRYGLVLVNGRCILTNECRLSGRVDLGNGRCGCLFTQIMDSQGRCHDRSAVSECRKRGLQELGDGRCGCPFGQETDSRGRCISADDWSKLLRQETDECARRGLVRIGNRCGCPQGQTQDTAGRCVTPQDVCAQKGLQRVGDRCGCPYGQVQDKIGRCVATKAK
jgi:hypothetical protein